MGANGREKRLTLREAHRSLSKTMEFQNLMESVILNLRQGFYGRIIGYVTPAGGKARARIRTARYSKCVVVEWDLGEEFNDAHYRSIFDQVFLHPFRRPYQLDDILHALWERRDGGSSWADFDRSDWWHGAVLSIIKREVGRNARVLCEQVFEAVKLARDDPKEAERRRRRDRAQHLRTVRNSVRGALEFGVTKKELSDAIDSAIVESVMEV